MVAAGPGVGLDLALLLSLRRVRLQPLLVVVRLLVLGWLPWLESLLVPLLVPLDLHQAHLVGVVAFLEVLEVFVVLEAFDDD